MLPFPIDLLEKICLYIAARIPSQPKKHEIVGTWTYTPSCLPNYRPFIIYLKHSKFKILNKQNKKHEQLHIESGILAIIFYSIAHRYYNAGERPTTEILHRQPELMHRVKWRFGVHMLMQDLYDSMEWPDWRLNQDTIHLLINHRSYLDPHFKEYPDFNDRNIQHYPYMFGQLARLVLPKRPSSATVRRYWNSTTVALDGIVNGQRSPDPTHDWTSYTLPYLIFFFTQMM